MHTHLYTYTESLSTVKPIFKTIWEIGITWELRTATPIPRHIQYIEVDLRNKTTSKFRTVFHSPMGVPNSKFHCLHITFGDTNIFDIMWTNYSIKYWINFWLIYFYLIIVWSTSADNHIEMLPSVWTFGFSVERHWVLAAFGVIWISWSSSPGRLLLIHSLYQRAVPARKWVTLLPDKAWTLGQRGRTRGSDHWSEGQSERGRARVQTYMDFVFTFPSLSYTDKITELNWQSLSSLVLPVNYISEHNIRKVVQYCLSCKFSFIWAYQM